MTRSDHRLGLAPVCSAAAAWRLGGFCRSRRCKFCSWCTGAGRGSRSLTSLRQAVAEDVVVGFVVDENVLGQLEPGGQIERAGRDGGSVFAVGSPEQVAAAHAAEPTLRYR